MTLQYGETRPALSAEAIEELWFYLLRDAEVREAAVTSLQASYFNPDTEAHLILLWLVTSEAHKQGTVRYRALRRALSMQIDDDRGLTVTPQAAQYLLCESEVRDDTGLLDFAFNHVAAETLPTSDGIALLRQFLEERSVISPLQQLAMSQQCGTVPTNYSQILSSLSEQRDRIQQLGASAAAEAIPENWFPTPIRGIPSMVAPFDHFLPMGQPFRGVLGLLAPINGGKTTTVSALAVNTAKQFQHAHDADGEPLRMVVLATYEEPLDRLRNRVIAAAAQVSKTTLDTARTWDDVAGPGERRQYEGRIDAQPEYRDGENLLSERERIDLARHWVNRNVRLLDMSGIARDGGSRPLGSGYIPELITELRKLERQQNMTIGWLGIDYMGKMIDRHLRGAASDFDGLRHWIRGTPDEFRCKIAEPFDCTVWLMHQLSGESNRRGAAARVSHADAAEGKMFAENLHYCFALGTRDPGTGMSLLHCTKDRDGGKSGQQLIVEVDGELQCIRNRADEFAIDAITNRIEAARDIHRMGGEAAAVATTPPQQITHDAHNWGP